MTGSSLIPADTLAAYRQTHYHVCAAAPFVLRIGQRCAALRAAHARRAVKSSAFVSACNPGSDRLDETSNAARHRALVRELTQAGHAFLEGVGRHPSNGWPPEPSVLVFGFGREAARALGQRLEQNALLWNGPDAVPQLILLR